MTLIACGECGGDVSSEAKACQKCGAALPSTKWWLWIPLALLTVFFGYGFIAASSPEAKAKASARAAISYCWDQQGRQSLSGGEQQFVAGACEMMEKDFQTKFGLRP